MNNGELIDLLNNYPLSYEIVIDGSKVFLLEESGSEEKQILFIKK